MGHSQNKRLRCTDSWVLPFPFVNVLHSYFQHIIKHELKVIMMLDVPPTPWERGRDCSLVGRRKFSPILSWVVEEYSSFLKRGGKIHWHRVPPNMPRNFLDCFSVWQFIKINVIVMAWTLCMYTFISQLVKLKNKIEMNQVDIGVVMSWLVLGNSLYFMKNL